MRPLPPCFTFALSCVLAWSAPFAQAQVQPVPATANRTITPKTTGFEWKDLTPAQHQALQPLGNHWHTLTEAHQRKWLAFAQTFPKLSSIDQARAHGRMTDWSQLTSRERQEARLNFAETKQLAPDEKRAKWQAYQALSLEEKQQLAAKAGNKPVGAATAITPVPKQKLAEVPEGKAQRRSTRLANATDTNNPSHSNALVPQGQPAQNN